MFNRPQYSAIDQIVLLRARKLLQNEMYNYEVFKVNVHYRQLCIQYTREMYFDCYYILTVDRQSVAKKLIEARYLICSMHVLCPFSALFGVIRYYQKD